MKSVEIVQPKAAISLNRTVRGLPVEFAGMDKESACFYWLDFFAFAD